MRVVEANHRDYGRFGVVTELVEGDEPHVAVNVDLLREPQVIKASFLERFPK